ncbi:inactive phospholipase C-like protein 2 isoform X4 [Lynx rufus]|uniref:inactive phospholipase C-like protein 2 isoform X4 n=1 Tax=Lynx rufus TaxID=61384 RepID=UPI001F126EDD|nr:inactive phospholipase C-like protein 2 isoform X4 [Lynx rufus]
MAECGRGGAAGGALPTSPGPALGAKGALKAGAGEGGGGGGGGSSGGGGGGRLGHGRARYDSGGVSNGDCSLGVSGDEARASPARGPRGAALAPTPSPAACPLPRESKPGGLPRRSSIIKDGTKQKRERKKTVSFSSMPTEKKISSASDCINSMVEGSELKKVRSNSRIYHRYFLLDADMQSLRWEPSKKDSEKAKIDIKSIKEVRTGKNTDIFRSNGISDQISEDCAFSVIYGENYESLDLVANSADVANIWVTGLRYLISYGKHTLDMLESSQDNMRTSWVSHMFSEIDVEDLGHITLCNAVQCIRNLNPGLKTSKIELKFKELHKSKDKAGTEVTKEEFVEVFHELCTRPEIYFLLVQFSSNKEFLDTKDLMMFLEAEQGVAHINEEISLEIIHKYEPSKEGKEKGWLSIDGFTNYLMSPDCYIFDPEHKKVCQDMKQPLSHYFINSSHNTYLIEDQFRGPSDITGYIRALKMGCRSVELDVWDGPDNEPVIYTGHTMTSQIVFRSVIDIINKYAFFASEYPLILCLENHCSIKQQKVMVQHMKKILGDKLYTTSPNVEESYLPSPDVLKGRILIKAKKLSSNCSGVEGDVTDEDEGAEMSQRMGKENVEQPNNVPVKRFQLCKELSELSLTGEVLAHASLFVHVAITNRRGGGKPHKRGLSVRKGKKSREYASLRTLWIKTVDEVFKNAQPPIRDATDLRENMQNAVVSFKELCGLSSVANLMQCMLAVSPRFLGADNTPLVVLNLSEQYPTMELQGIVPEVLKKIVTTYDMMIQSLKAVIENADAVYEKIVHCQKAAMEFHEHLHSIGTKEGLKERKLQKAVESFTWNITILKGQADLLKYAKNETLENLKQIHYAAVSCGLNKPGTENADVQKPRRSLEVIPEKANDETGD